MNASKSRGDDHWVPAIRAFNRFYTEQIGVLNDGLLKSPFSLTEVRVLYELAQAEAPGSTELGKSLGLDAGYLSRLLDGLVKRGLIERTRSQTDSRRSQLGLTKAGRKTFAGLDDKASAEIQSLLAPLDSSSRDRLVGAMNSVRHLLGSPAPSHSALILRPHRPGDMGWVTYRHGVLYAQEYNWDERFEALVGKIASEFIEKLDPRRERCWMAERDGDIVGSVFLVTHSKTVAQLRLLLVEPKARGLGVGGRLVEECIRFARTAGYRKIRLWTNSVLVGARRIYERAGFVLVEEKPHTSFGHRLMGQTWELDLHEMPAKDPSYSRAPPTRPRARA